jgi:hypothetical protein
MKKLILSLILISAVSFGQEIIRPASDYYSADSIRNRTDMNRSSADAVKIWKDSGFVEMQVKLYQPTLIYRFPKIDMNVIRDTVYVGQDLDTVVNDTIVWGWSKIRFNKMKRILFTYRTKLGGYETVQLKVRDTTIFRPCPQTDFCDRDSMQFNIRRQYVGQYLQPEAYELEMPADTTQSSFKIIESVIRSSNSSGMKIQTYATEDWLYNYKLADTYNSSTGKCENWQPQWNSLPEYQAGNPQNYQTPDGVIHPSLWRHTTNSAIANKKCVKIGVQNKITGQMLEGPVHVNPDM